MGLLDAALLSVLWMIFIAARDWQKWQAGARWSAQQEEKQRKAIAQHEAVQNKMEQHAAELVKMTREDHEKEAAGGH